MGIQAPALSSQQVDNYASDGYLLLKNLIPAERLSRYNQRFLDFVEGKLKLPAEMKIMQDVMIVKGAVKPASAVHGVNKLLCFENDPELFAFAREPGLVSAVQSLLGAEIYSLSSNVFNKPPGVDGRHPMHQDLRYFRLRPADKIMGVWTALLPANRHNGCLSVIPGSHKGELLEHANPDWDFINHGFYGINGVELGDRVHIEMAPGDTLLFHPLLIHGSGTNQGKDFRRAISVHFAAADCQSDKPGWQHSGLTRRIA